MWRSAASADDSASEVRAKTGIWRFKRQFLFTNDKHGQINQNKNPVENGGTERCSRGLNIGK